jgi:hypothetical protein
VFARFFLAGNGRPTKDIQSMLGLFLLQALFDLTDDETIEAYFFRETFRYALDLSRDDCLAERTYYYYRAKLLSEGLEALNKILERIAKLLDLDPRIQRKDSTLVKTGSSACPDSNSSAPIVRIIVNQNSS